MTQGRLGQECTASGPVWSTCPHALGEAHGPCPGVPGGNERGGPGWPTQGLAGLRETRVEEQLLLSQQGQGRGRAPTGQLQRDGKGRGQRESEAKRGTGDRPVSRGGRLGPAATCSVSQPICLTSWLPAAPVAASSTCSSSLTQGTRAPTWAWMAPAHDLALASSLALKKRASWPSAAQISRYLRAQMEQGRGCHWATAGQP